MAYENGLYVSGQELENTSADAQDYLTKFNNATSEFYRNAKELQNYWDGADYNAMMNNFQTKLDPLVDPNTGSIPQLIKDITKELDERNQAYHEIQNSNTSDWG